MATFVSEFKKDIADVAVNDLAAASIDYANIIHH